MRTKGTLGHVNRAVSGVLALAWACTAIGAVVAAYLTGRRLLWLAAIFALGYAALWVRVAARGRLLRWTEISAPWRGR